MKILKQINILFIFIMCLGQSIYSQTDSVVVEVDSTGESIFLKSNSYTPTVPIDSLIFIGKSYLGLPYRTTERAPWPLDCSGYVSMLYGQFGVSLPHSSGGIAQVTKTIPLKEVQPGDMLFFRGRDSKKNRVGHVALVVEVNDNNLLMMHSTCSKGIIIEPYPDGYYYTRRFVKAGRIIQ